MIKKSNILIVVEGNKTEPRFFKRLAEVFGLECEIYCFSTNIYSLYKRMKEYDFNVDIKEILKQEHKEKEEILSKNFAYTYLVFDCDLHHPKKSENRVTKDIVSENFKMLKEMAQYFIDETDPTIGKLYINYPMMESYRDSDSFFEEAFAKRKISLSKLKGYKQEVSARKLCKIHINQYEKRHFELLILQNLYKWHFTCHGLWDKPEYNLYVKETDNLSLLAKQQQLSIEQECLSVINTSLFLILDYYGNRDGFYQKLIINGRTCCFTYSYSDKSLTENGIISNFLSFYHFYFKSVMLMCPR